MDTKQKEDLLEVFGEAFREVVPPVLEDLEKKIVTNLTEKIDDAKREIIEELGDRIDKLEDRFEVRMDKLEVRVKKLETTAATS